MDIFDGIKEKLMQGENDDVEVLVRQALADDISPEDILYNSLIPGMDEIGLKFQENEIYIPEMLIAAKAMKAGMKILEPLLVEKGVESRGRVVIGTVRGDLHDIGKNLVAMMLEGSGFEVTDAGADVSPEKFMGLIEDTGAKIVGMSALLTTTMVEMKNIISVFEDKGLREKVKIMVGGAPLSNAFAKEIGADGYARDAASAVDLAKTFVGK